MIVFTRFQGNLRNLYLQGVRRRMTLLSRVLAGGQDERQQHEARYGGSSSTHRPVPQLGVRAQRVRLVEVSF